MSYTFLLLELKLYSYNSENRKMCRNRKNILIKCARQIGKTESIEHFAEEHYEYIVRISFVLEQKYKTIVSDGYDVICSGSLLGLNYKKIHSNSVGYKTDYEMFSMDFEEFLWAKGYDNSAIEDILQHMKSMKPFSETEFMVYKKLFLDYCVLGVMPAVVRQYIETGTFSGTLEIQNQIRMDYEEISERKIGTSRILTGRILLVLSGALCA